MASPLGKPGGVFLSGIVWEFLSCLRYCLLCGSYSRRFDMRFLVLLFAFASHAAFALIPASAVTEARYTSGPYDSGWQPSYQAGCSALAADFQAKSTFPSVGELEDTFCLVKSPEGSLRITSGGTFRSVLICPANSTLVGSSCECTTPYLQQSGACVAPPVVTCPAAGTVSEAIRYYTTDLASTPRFYGHSDGDCVVEETSRVCTGDGTGYHCLAENKYTGASCGASGCQGAGTSDAHPSQHPEHNPSDPPNSGPCQPGYYYGTVNGQTVCVPGRSTSTSSTTSTTTTGPAGTVEKSQTTVTTTGTSPSGTQTTQTTQTTLEQQWSAARQITHQSESTFPTAAIPSPGETKTTTVTNPDGSKTEYTLTKNGDGTVSGTARDQNTVQKTESTTCTGSSCSVTSTTTTNGAETGSTTGTTSKDGLCQSDPSNAQCGDGDGVFAGTCASGFTCDGDAIQCAMAKRQHEAVCALVENKSPESELYDAEKNKPGNVTGDNPSNSTHAIGSGMFDYSSALGAGACIADKSVTVMGQSISIPFSSVCPWLSILGNILVALSSLVAMRIVTRG